MRRPLSSKSDICMESMDVDAAGISVKVSAHYPGRSPPRNMAEKSADGIVVSQMRDEGLNMKLG